MALPPSRLISSTTLLRSVVASHVVDRHRAPSRARWACDPAPDPELAPSPAPFLSDEQSARSASRHDHFGQFVVCLYGLLLPGVGCGYRRVGVSGAPAFRARLHLVLRHGGLTGRISAENRAEDQVQDEVIGEPSRERHSNNPRPPSHHSQHHDEPPPTPTAIPMRHRAFPRRRASRIAIEAL